MQTLISINPVKWLISCLSFRPITKPRNTLIVLLDPVSEAGVLDDTFLTLTEIKNTKKRIEVMGKSKIKTAVSVRIKRAK